MKSKHKTTDKWGRVAKWQHFFYMHSDRIAPFIDIKEDAYHIGLPGLIQSTYEALGYASLLKQLILKNKVVAHKYLTADGCSFLSHMNKIRECIQTIFWKGVNCWMSK